MSGITLSAGVRQSLSTLQAATAQTGQIQNRLATGRKVNSALDNPAAFFTSSGLNNRASDLGRLMDDMDQAVKTLQAADKGISAITKLVENAQSIAKQAKAFKREESEIKGDAATELTTNTNLFTLDSSFSATSATTGNPVITLKIKGENGASDTTITFSVTSSSTVGELVTALDDHADIEASIEDGELKIVDTKGRRLELDATKPGASATVDHNVNALVGAGNDTAAATENKRVNLQQDYEALLTQIDQLAKDSSYNGVNLLDGDELSVQFNEKGTSKLDIAGTSISSKGLNLDSAKLLSDADIDDAMKKLKGSLDTLRSQAATFGSNLSVVQNRQDFTKGMINTLRQGADSLVLADPNEEGANLLALQTRSQLASTTLSMASQADQAVLRLF